MPPVRVVIISGQSLFAEGVASRLEQFPETTGLEVMHPQQSDLKARLTDIQPVVIIMDSNDAETAHLCPIITLMHTMPDSKIVCLDSQKEQVQVITSRNYPAPDIRDLIKAII